MQGKSFQSLFITIHRFQEASKYNQSQVLLLSYNILGTIKLKSPKENFKNTINNLYLFLFKKIRFDTARNLRKLINIVFSRPTNKQNGRSGSGSGKMCISIYRHRQDRLDVVMETAHQLPIGPFLYHVFAPTTGKNKHFVSKNITL